jgi:hypothetical protein
LDYPNSLLLVIEWSDYLKIGHTDFLMAKEKWWPKMTALVVQFIGLEIE